MMVRSPGLLDASLREVCRLCPTAGSLTLTMTGTSEATLTLPEGSPTVAMHDWLSIYNHRGFAGIFRVSNVQQTHSEQIDLTLLHGIDILSDSVWADQTEFSGTKAEYIAQLLAHQTQQINGQRPWKLGRCEDTAKVEREINYDRLSSLMEELEEDGNGFYFVYDQTTFPWTVHYVAKPQEVASEFRLARNVHSASVTVNDAELCTRLIVSVNVRTEDADTGTTSTETTIRSYNDAEAQKRWGIVVKTADIDTKDDIEANHFANADEWAKDYMARHREPAVQIEIDGEELCRETGDTWDETTIGTMCRVALPDYGQTYTERVVSVHYPDFLGQPERIDVSLANKRPKFSEGITDVRRTAESAARTARSASRGAASAKELTTWSQIVKYYGEALDGTGVMTLYESGIEMSATDGVKIFSLIEGVQSLYADIKVNATEISSIVQKTGINSLGQKETLYSKVTQTASLIEQEVKRATEAEGVMSSTIRQQADEISLKVSKDGIASAINQTAQSVLIQANKINLSGYVTASQLSATNATIENLMSGTASAQRLVSSSASLGSVTCTSLTVAAGGANHYMTAKYKGYLDANGEVQYAYFLST